jgi:hypothetical protein
MQGQFTSWRVKPPVHQAGRGPARLVVTSIGAAGVTLIRSLRHVLPLADADIAALLFQAPSELLAGLEHRQAEGIAQLLRETGLECAVLDAGEPLDEGSGDHEVALSVRDVAHIPAVLVEVVRLLGVDVATARALICGSPAVLLGGISIATVNALRARFDALGADLDASRSEDARFDLYLGDCPAAIRHRAIDRLRAAIGPLELSAPAPSGPSGTSGPLVVLGLDHATAARVWRELRQSDVPARIVNREFSRYDVLLHAATDNDDLRRHLTARAGMPAAVVPRVLARLPVVIHRGLRHAALESVTDELARAGAAIVVEPLAFQRFNLTLGEVREPRPLVPVICAIAGMDEAATVTALRGRPARLAGMFPPLQARWLQHELRRAGVDARLEAS